MFQVESVGQCRQTTRYVKSELNIVIRGQISDEFLISFTCWSLLGLEMCLYTFFMSFYELLQAKLHGDMIELKNSTRTTYTQSIIFLLFFFESRWTFCPTQSLFCRPSRRYQHETAEFLIVISLVFLVFVVYLIRASHDYLEQFDITTATLYRSLNSTLIIQTLLHCPSNFFSLLNRNSSNWGSIN